MKYKVGDRVRIVSEWPEKAKINKDGLMDRWRGEIMTIRSIEFDAYRMIEDKIEWNGGWYWFENLVEGLEEEQFDEVDMSEFRKFYQDI